MNLVIKGFVRGTNHCYSAIYYGVDMYEYALKENTWATGKVITTNCHECGAINNKESQRHNNKCWCCKTKLPCTE